MQPQFKLNEEKTKEFGVELKALVEKYQVNGYVVDLSVSHQINGTVFDKVAPEVMQEAAA